MSRRLTLLLLALLLCAYRSTAQHHLFSLGIADTNYVPAVSGSGGTVTLSFGNPTLDAIAASGPVYNFEQAYPGSTSPFLQQLYFLELDDPNQAENIRLYDTTVFYYLREIPQTEYESVPNDFYQASISGCADSNYALNLIGALGAWQFTQGDSNVIIGIVDAGFQPSHREFINERGTSQFYRVRDSVNHNGPGWHGTTVAAIAAGGTNNGMGLAAIGWNCRLDVSSKFSTYGGLKEMMAMSRDTVRVLNGSWVIQGGKALEDEMAVNEIYENGASQVYSAGDGAYHSEPSSDYKYPASYHNVLSITGVGATYDTTGGLHYRDLKDWHEQAWTNNAHSDSLNTLTHNDMADLCAPGYDIDAITSYNPSDPNAPFIECQGQTGNSFSAPYVAGTIGLMLSVNRMLSPYQIECILKNTAKDIYSVGTNYRYLGRLGKGRLRADVAVDSARRYEVNDPATQTMYVTGIDFNHLCYDPTGAVAKPQLSVSVTNGIGTLRYEWQAFADNQVQLNNLTSGTPTVTSASGSLFHYVVRVFDASSIMKVALREVKFHLRFPAQGSDLAMMDSYFDMLDEPNSQYEVDHYHYDIWHSPDLWVRDTSDGITEPQNPEYFTSGNPNYVYCRVRNVGCAATYRDENYVETYWTLSSTNEHWRYDWDGTTTFGGIPAGGRIPGGGTDTIPALNPGDSAIIQIAWHPRNPALYPGNDSSLDACLLARIIETSKPDSGFYRPDTALRSATGVTENNNIVTRNATLVNLNRLCAGCRIAGAGSGSGGSERHIVIVANTEDSDQEYVLQMLSLRDMYRHLSGDISPYCRITLELGDLYDRWQSGGFLGSYESKDDIAKTVTYNPAHPLRLEGIVLQANEHLPVYITFSMISGVSVPYEISDFRVFIRQLLPATGKVCGAVSYDINIGATPGYKHAQTGAGPAPAVEIPRYSVYPNPTTGMLNIRYIGTKGTTASMTISDITGAVLLRKEGVPLQANGAYQMDMKTIASGVYVLKIEDASGNSVVRKIVKE